MNNWRYQEWQALMAYAHEELAKHPPVGGISGLPDLNNLPIECLCLGGEINTIERARAVNWCLQRHWEDMRRLGGAEAIDKIFEPWLKGGNK